MSSGDEPECDVFPVFVLAPETERSLNSIEQQGCINTQEQNAAFLRVSIGDPILMLGQIAGRAQVLLGLSAAHLEPEGSHEQCQV